METARSRGVVVCRSNPIAPDPRVEKVAISLAGAGYAVTVVGWDRTGKMTRQDAIDDVSVERLLIRADYGTGLGNLLGLLRWQWGLLSWLVRNRSAYGVIHACDFDTVLPALLLKLFSGKRVIYDIFDFYADHLRATPGWIKAVIRRVDVLCIRWADAVILVDETRREQITGARPRQTAVIYNTPRDVRDELDLETSTGGKGRDERQSRKVDLALVYVGLLQAERGLFELLSVLRDHPEWYLDLAGFGGDEVEITGLVTRMPNVRWHGRIAYRRALQLSHSADVVLAIYDPAIKNHRYASPNKVFEAMMLGKPLVVARGTNIDWLVEKYDCGVVLDYGDALKLEAGLIHLQGNPELRRRMGANARRAYEESYRWSEMQKRLVGLYASVWPGLTPS